jgi:hypothetical protein
MQLTGVLPSPRERGMCRWRSYVQYIHDQVSSTRTPVQYQQVHTQTPDDDRSLDRRPRRSCSLLALDLTEEGLAEARTPRRGPVKGILWRPSSQGGEPMRLILDLENRYSDETWLAEIEVRFLPCSPALRNLNDDSLSLPSDPRSSLVAA